MASTRISSEKNRPISYADTILNLRNDENRTDRLFLDKHLTSTILNLNVYDVIFVSCDAKMRLPTYRYHIYYFMHRYSHDNVIIMSHHDVMVPHRTQITQKLTRFLPKSNRIDKNCNNQDPRTSSMTGPRIPGHWN